MIMRLKYAYDVGRIFFVRRKSMGRLIIDGNRVYELDETCLQRKRNAGRQDEAERMYKRKNERENQMRRR